MGGGRGGEEDVADQTPGFVFNDHGRRHRLLVVEQQHISQDSLQETQASAKTLCLLIYLFI